MENPRERETCSASAQAEEQAFDEQLPGDARAARTQRRADGHLAAPRSRASELKAGHVGCGGREQQADGGQQHEERLPNVGGQRIAKRLCRDPHGTVAAEDGHGRQPGVGRRSPSRRPFGRSLRRGDARTQRRHGVEHRQEVSGRGSNGVWNDGACLPVRVCLSLRQYADRRIRLAIELYRTAQHRGIPSETLPPERF